MNVEIGTETAQFPEKEYIDGIFLAVALGNPSVPPPGCRQKHRNSVPEAVRQLLSRYFKTGYGRKNDSWK
jgi:hypothetical protein